MKMFWIENTAKVSELRIQNWKLYFFNDIDLLVNLFTIIRNFMYIKHSPRKNKGDTFLFASLNGHIWNITYCN